MQLNVSHTTDELLKQLHLGSQEAFAALYQRYSEKLYRNILSLVKDENTAEELLQDIFIKIWQHRESIYIKQKFEGYLFRLSYNRVIDYFRQVKRDRELYTRLQKAASRYYTHIEEAMITRENEELLFKAIAGLSPQRRLAYKMCKLDGLSYQEASERMGISLSTLKNHMASARQHIYEFILTHQEIAFILTFVFCCQNDLLS